MRDDNMIVNEVEQPQPTQVQLSTNGNGKNVTSNPNAPALQMMIIDCHEPETLIEAFKQEKGIYVIVKELESGDYVFSNIGIERKTLKDFYGSISTGDKRIWQQMFNLKKVYERPMLVIERWEDSFVVESYRQNAVLGAMAHIAMMGITVIVLPGQSRDWRPFVDFVSFMFFASDKKEPSFKPIPKKGHQETVLDVREDMICMIPLIGRKRAKEILSKYLTIEDLVNADENDIRKRLGPKTGQMFLDVLKKRFGGDNGKEKENTEIKTNIQEQHTIQETLSTQSGKDG